MRKLYLMCGVLFAGGAMAQGVYEGPYRSSVRPSTEELAKADAHANWNNGTEAVLWSEDFGGGLSGSSNGAWVTSGANSSLIIHSMTAASNLIQFGWDPIPSPTSSNGFAMFDFYDNHPNGFAADPMEALLTSPTIALGPNDTAVVIEFYQQLYWCCEIGMDIFLEVSSDGGTTWDQYKVNNFNRNDRHWDLGMGYKWRFDISESVKADPTNVKIRFNWTSLNADQNGQYSSDYFWAIDDIVISELPLHSLEFTSTEGGDSPRIDIISDGDGSVGRYGIITGKQVRPVNFDANIVNFGATTQENVQLEVQIWDDSNNLIQTLQSPTVASLPSKDTARWNQLTTAQWSPPATTEGYRIVYIAKSDSVNGTVAMYDTDTINYYVTDSLWSLDRNVFNNPVGTEEMGDDGSIMAVRMDLQNDERLFGVDVWLSTRTEPGGIVDIYVHDSTGFPTNIAPAVAYGQHIITQQDIDNRSFRVDLTNNGVPVYLSTQNTGAYYIKMDMFSSNGASPIEVRNDQTIIQQGRSKMMYTTFSTPAWFVGFTDDTYNAPHIRAITCPAATAAACMTITIDELNLDNQVTVGPNPAFDYVKVSYGDDFSGAYNFDIIDLNGRVIMQGEKEALPGSFDYLTLSDLTGGVYMLNIRQGEAVSTFKLSVN